LSHLAEGTNNIQVGGDYVSHRHQRRKADRRKTKPSATILENQKKINNFQWLQLTLLFLILIASAWDLCLVTSKTNCLLSKWADHDERWFNKTAAEMEGYYKKTDTRITELEENMRQLRAAAE
jgi:hypothetical protein